MRGDGLKLHQGTFTSDVRKMLFAERVSKVTGEVVVAPSLSVFKVRLGNALRSMV